MPTRLLLLVAALSAFAAPAAAQELQDRSPRLAANLALGFAGELDSQINDTRGEVDTEPSVGFDVRFELPVLDFLVVGASFGFLSVEPEGTSLSDPEREETFSFDGLIRARWVFEAVMNELFIEPYVLVPVGFSMAILPDDDGSGDDVWPGWNLSVVAGAQFIHGSGFGGYVEMGWRHAEVYDHRSATVLGVTVNTDLSLILNELALNVGAVYVFGG